MTGIRLHERHNVVSRASTEIELAVLKLVKDMDLTDAEYGMALTSAFNGLLGGYFKTALRVERHGDPDTPSGWASEDDEEDDGPGEG